MIKLMEILNEMPTMSRRGKSAYADQSKLRDLKVEDVIDNIVVFRLPKANMLFPEGFFMAYFMDSLASTDAMKHGKIGYLIVPDRPRYAFDSAPIKDIWQKKHSNNGQEHILGIVQGVISEKEIYVDKMTVRPGWKRNTINSKLVQALKKEYPNRELNFSGPTPDGRNFIKNFTGQDWKPAHGETPEF